MVRSGSWHEVGVDAGDEAAAICEACVIGPLAAGDSGRFKDGGS
jgi:hypothetical protein